VSVRLSKAVFSSDKNSRGQLTLASSGGKAILSPSRGYTKSTPFGGGSFIMHELLDNATRLATATLLTMPIFIKIGLKPAGYSELFWSSPVDF